MMFVKRVSKIRTIQKQYPEPAGRKTLRNNEFKQSITRFKVYLMCIDPHGRLMAGYSQKNDTYYIIPLISFVTLMREHRKALKYSLEEPLSPDISIANPHPSLNTLVLKFTACIQNTQFLIIAYYPNIIDLYSVNTGKIVESININKQTSVGAIITINCIGHSLFISLYDGSLLCYEGKQLSTCKKYKKQYVRFTYDFDISESAMGSKNRLVPLYADKSNRLFLGFSELQHGFESKVAKDSSLEEFIRLEEEKYEEGKYQFYTLSACERFLICSDLNSRYGIRYRGWGWQYICEPKFDGFPVINRFAEDGWQGPLDSDKHKRDKHKLSLIIALISSPDVSPLSLSLSPLSPLSPQKQEKIINASEETDIQQKRDTDTDEQRERENKNEKQANHRISIFRISVEISEISVAERKQSAQTKKQSKIEVVAELNNMKRAAIQIEWIGPTMLLVRDEGEDVYYVEIDRALFKII